MKKVILSIILCFLFILTPFVATGCKDKQYTKDDVASLVSAMKSDETTSQFFQGNFIKVNFDVTKVGQTPNDKGYIFPAAYSYYLDSASGLFFGVLDRFANAASVVVDFSSEQINIMYEKLNNVYSKLKTLAASKVVLETSNGNLHYKNVISDYNALIDACYSLNDSFADFYFVEGIAKTNFRKEELSNNNVRDMLRYILLQASKPSYKYDLLNFAYTNPLSEIATWFNATSYLKPYIDICHQTLIDLSNLNNLALLIGPNTEEAKILFASFHDQELHYENEYRLFLEALSNFNVKAYFNSNNKSAYLENCSKTEQSSFNIINNFLTGRYYSVINCLKLVNGYI